MYALVRTGNFISKFIFAAIFLLGICGASVRAQDTLTVCFMGDMMMHTKQIETADKGEGKYDFSSYFRLIEDRIKAADIAVANMEFTLGGGPYSGYPCFSAPDSYAYYLADCGFDVFLAANNHIFDTGSAGASRTIEIYRTLGKEKGIRFTGIAGSEEERKENYPLFMSRNGIDLAFVNFTYGTNLGGSEHWPKTNYMGRRSEIKQALDSAKVADVVIALPHWGPEYVLEHSQQQEETAEWLVDNGSDMIIGSHPHVVQDTTSIGNVPVIYSLGNAVSNMSAANTQVELMATVRIVKDIDGKTELLPIELTWLWCSRPGGFSNGYTVIPIEEYLGTRDSWTGAWEYDKMVSTYERIRK